MDKITFLNELEQELHRLSKYKRDLKMFEYERYFFDEEKKGKSEYQIVGELEAPKTLARKIMVKDDIKRAEFEPTIKNVVRAISTSFSVSLLSSIIASVPLLLLAMLFIITILIGAILMLSPLILILNGWLNDNMSMALSNYLFTLSYIGLGMMMIATALGLMKYFHRWVITFLRWNNDKVKRRATS
ncbi:DUF1700 domain-containing protein [Staphylococcus sp. SQ8-PEA]|uniref:DUF1700 domain-containing protein n=1 Tax=Staphylococcus marylandisciuri TaxID=2981529 RepID=A0ABT2QQB8_9STAP|nr:DUF1700 domain-containing protein [Staphylococcus marylandisciuri]MCU5746181.1 DUF1700 domain-containing protein [Staphylococcus marylandisciuri]